MSTSQDMTEQEIWQELVRFTGNEYAAAGIMGNLKAESNMNSSNLQGTYEQSLGHSDESYTRAVDNGTYTNFVNDSAGYGLAQWTYYSRKQGLLDYAKETGQSIGSTKMQLQYLENELSSGYQSTLNALKNATSVQEASDIMITQYERPANQSSEAKNKRASYANDYLSQYSGTGAAASQIDLSGTGNGDGDSISSALSDVTLELQPDSLSDVCKEWESKILSIDLSSIKVTSTYAPLTGEGVASSYIPSLETALTKAENTLLSISKTIKAAADQHNGVENPNGNNGNNYYNGGNGNYSNGGSNNETPSGNDDYQFEIPKVITSTTTTTTKPTEEEETPQKEITINTEFTSKISDLDTNSYIKFMTVIGTIANGNLLGYISDEKLASKLKKALLDSPNLDSDLRTMVSSMDENEIQVTLQSILTDKDAIPDASKHIIYEYTEALSKDTNIDVLKVSKEIQFYNQVDDLFNTVSSIIEKDNLQQNLFALYDGDVDAEISTESIDFIRVTVDYLANVNNVDYEELLTNKDYEDLLKNELEDLTKALSYFRTVNTMGTEASQLLYDNIMKEMD